MRVQSPLFRLTVLTALLAVAIVFYLTWDARASWSFTLNFRGKKLATLLLVGSAIGIATLLFQTLSQNRILTPGIMGFDALYVLIQSTLVFSLGVIGFTALNPYLKWLLETLIMVGCMLLMFQVLFRGSIKSLQLMMLAGIILGVFFTSLSSLIFRLLDPTQFIVLQDSLFATFGSIPASLLNISLAVFGLAIIWLWRVNNQLDVLLLGEASATSLGIDYPKFTRRMLVLIALLVSLSTALVGPVSFFGLLVVHLSYQFCPSFHHRYLIPYTALIGMLTLVLGDFMLQHIFQFNTRLSIIIEFVGGLFFLALIIKQGKA